MESTLIKLTNPEFELEFDGKTYRVRKANLDKVVQYYAKVEELSKAKTPATDYVLAAFCIYLVLHSTDANITEQEVLDKTPGDIDVMETLSALGFISPRNMERAKQLQNAVASRLNTEKSSSISPSEQGGVPIPSGN